MQPRDALALGSARSIGGKSWRRLGQVILIPLQSLVAEVPNEFAVAIQHLDAHAVTGNELLLQDRRLRQHVAQGFLTMDLILHDETLNLFYDARQGNETRNGLKHGRIGNKQERLLPGWMRTVSGTGIPNFVAICNVRNLSRRFGATRRMKEPPFAAVDPIRPEIENGGAILPWKERSENSQCLDRVWVNH